MSNVATGTTSSEVDYDPFAGESLAGAAPTTESQREVWLADRLGHDASLAYNESITLRFHGPMDLDALVRALNMLLRRHEALRATISADGEELLFARSPTLALTQSTCRGLDASGRVQAISDAARRAVDTPFDVAAGPLFRANILAFDPEDHALVLAAHHIVCDGWSFGILVDELGATYGGRELPAAESYAAYSQLERARASTAEHAADEEYWLGQFSAKSPVLDLPSDRPRKAWRTFSSRREDRLIEPALFTRIRMMGQKQGASLFSTLLAAFAATLSRIAGAEDLVIGVPSAGQSATGMQRLVGHCVNLLPIRIAIDAHSPLTEVIATTQGTFLDAFDHAQYTFGTLLRKLSLPRDPSRLPLVSVMFNLDQALDPESAGFTGLRTEFTSNPRTFENFELFVNAVQADGGLRLECQYNTDLFDPSTVCRWLDAFETLLQAACDAPATPVGLLPFASEADLAQVRAWNATDASFRREAFVQTLVEEQVKRSPERVAIRSDDVEITYAVLDQRANAIAQALRRMDVQPGSRVGLFLDRGPEMVVALLGVLKAGAAYVPMDPAYPIDRLEYMAADAGLAALLTRKALADALSWPRDKSLWLDDLAATTEEAAPALPGVNPEIPAYVIYTSGSTGKPKGVQVPHRAVVNFLQSMAREPGLSSKDRLVAVTTLSFDIAVNELLLPLTVGAEIVLASREQAGDGALLRSLIETHRANVVQATPATWRLLLEAGWIGSTSFRALCGGEPLTSDLAAALLQRCGELWNMYGPTETTVWSTCQRIGHSSPFISIGRPIANTAIWILDDRMQPCPIGVPGEIFIGGEGVTLGYLRRPELTAERFLDDPLGVPGTLMYRTGDRGRWRDGGLLEHLGRNDFQVKVRGYRIELGEIEAALLDHDDITRAVAIAREDRVGDVRLVAYVVSRATAPAEEDLKRHLHKTLPDYMVPQHIVAMPDIPLLANGKVDRKALPAPDLSSRVGKEFVAPRTELERLVAAEMEKSLGLPGIGIHDDFFSLGGHSLLAAQLTSRLNKSLDSHLSMKSLFEAPTIAGLAALIESAQQAPNSGRIRIAHRVNQTRAPASIMQERLWFLEELHPGRVNYHAPSAHRFKGVMDERAFSRAFSEMVRRQPSLRTRFSREMGELEQVVDPEVSISLFPAEDLSALPLAEREATLRKRLDELTAETFDLTLAPIFRARMFRLAPNEHALFFMPHHIIWDGWSFDLFYEEMSELYDAFATGRAHRLADLPLTYGDFSAWHRDWMAGTDFAQQVSFWRDRLSEISKAQDLPTDKPRRPGMSGAGSTEWIVVDKPKTDALHAFAKSMDTTLFIVMLAVYAVLLRAYAGQTRLVIGMPVRGRNSIDLEGIMGYFNNLLPLQIEMRADESLASLVSRVKSVVMESLTYPDVPLEQLSHELSSAGGSTPTLLYQALFSFQDARQRITRWGELQHENILVFQRGANEDLGMWFVESDAGLHGGITYNTEILLESTAQQLRKGFLAMLDLAISSTAMTIGSLGAALKLAPRNRQDFAVVAKPSSPVAAISPPTTPTQKLLATVWARLLGVEEGSISVTDNFFDLGGHSLLAMQVMNVMEEQLRKRINPRRFIVDSLGQVALAYDEASIETGGKQRGLRGLLSRLTGVKGS